MKFAKPAQWLFSFAQSDLDVSDLKRAAVDWEDVRVFIALARHGSLSAAARALSINHATVARRMQSLEAAMGERLVERRPDGYVLTPAGTRVLTPATDMEAAAASLGRRGADNGPKGLVRLNAPPSLTQAFIAPRLAELGAEQPGLDIDVATDMCVVSLERRETDIAVRFGRPQDGDVLARPLVNMGFGFYARRPAAATSSRAANRCSSASTRRTPTCPSRPGYPDTFRARVAFRTASHVGQAAAAASGGGLALLPHFIGRLEARLQPCPLDPSPPSRELWLVTRRQDRQDLAVRTVVDRLVLLFSESRELFE
jgi:molybdate transport repressor ModE-like protein